jgi:alkylation response protein AidB-like acyl-CoA dehydrogenase
MNSSAKPATDLKQFEAAAREFLEPRYPRRAVATAPTSSTGSIVLFEQPDPELDRANVERARQWLAERFDAGFGWITGPPEWGGAGLTAAHQELYEQIEADYEVPEVGNLHMGLTTIAPTVAAHGTDAQRVRFLPAIYRGELVACQLFSEPGAGSDLAALATRAERADGGWLLNGQKVWTSAAQHADIGEIVCRTDPSQPKHKGITAFIIELASPGVEIRPLRQMTGGASFNEVFLHDVWVPDDSRLGEVNDGWRVVMTSLAEERARIRSGPIGETGEHFRRVLELARAHQRTEDPLIRDRLARMAVQDWATQLLGQRIADCAGPNGAGPELALTKLALGADHRMRSDLVCDVLGAAVCAKLDDDDWGWADFVLSVPALGIAGGTDEIVRNTLGERILGLPKEPGPDPRTPYRDLARS